jgi:Tfp pilus assembly protein PilP
VTRHVSALIIGLAVTLCSVGNASAQAKAPSGAGQNPPAAAAAADKATAAEPQGYTYNPEGRRDPFVTLLKRGTDAQRPAMGARLAGLAGLGSSEVTLKGTLHSPNGYVALVQGADNKTYIVRSGDKLLDGTIRAISVNAMVILQQVNDPLSLEKQREVRKVLRQAEEVK